MNENDTRRLSRLTAILTMLQSGRLLTAPRLAAKFQVTVRTIYRDIKALEAAGVPVLTEEGKGYRLMEDYRIPPVMFTANEANALITAELLIRAGKDQSLINEFCSAIQKIKAVIPQRLKQRTALLEQKMTVGRIYTDIVPKSNYLTTIQQALVEYIVIRIGYKNAAGKSSIRELEPFAVYTNSKDEWVLIAWCRMRKEFRSFSLSAITNLELTSEQFDPHSITFTQYRKKVYGD
jgi:predicted DNA-binding transcriptional regulator YafY